MTSLSRVATKLIAIEITTSDPDRSRQVYRAVSGNKPELRAGGERFVRKLVITR